ESKGVLYEQSLAEFSNFVPNVPSAYEPGSVRFAGWYLNPECTGDEYKLDKKTMPAENVLLYAKWQLVTHTVKFYLDSETYEKGETLASHPDRTVKHNDFINGVDIPENGKYSFIGWFYLDNGEEKAFDFSNMPITKDMKVYGKWSSNVLVKYKIKYVIYIDKEKDLFVEIADETTGSALAGTSKTFEAKTGTELYDGYQTGYYPTIGSHNVPMNIDGENVYIFEYIALPDVEYTVRYIDKATGIEMADPKIVTTKDAVVTEVFKPITEYMPDAYQKRLVLSANEKENVIIFYYTKDTENAYYVITHWVQNIEGDGYSEYRSIQAPGKIGSTISEEPLTITGFTYNSTESKTSGKLTAEGLKLDLYYDRNTYPLKVQYLENGTNTPLADPYTTADKYRVGKQVSATAIDIKGYKLVGEQTKVKTISEPEESNVITFYYIEEEVTISYVAIEAGYGTVSVSQEIVKANTGAASGSTPTAKPRYRFVGWYTDEECTKPVDPSWVDSNNKLVPQKVDGLNVSATYYAKFVENLGDLTIKKNGCSEIDENQTFLFRLQGLDEGVNDHIDMVVTIHGNDSVTIKDLFVGNYSVTELTDWSFRYTPDAVTKNVNVTTNGLELTFNNNRSLLWWLDGSNYKVNLFKQGN
ncbi:MAG: InlB B-repeat-containing protein, partial [Erysipelotrichaceae bacterium]|nr:InlB B-repeat-containing protein [Erysipelotrichaceae bacterium]